MVSKYESDTSAKYLITVDYNVEGVVEVQDIVGALFGQTEGLLKDLELRTLQKNGRIGRIQVENESENGLSRGTISIPSSLNRNETAILSATLEMVDRVGPCQASLKIVEIKDIREEKRTKIKERALDILQKWNLESIESQTISKELDEELQPEVIRWRNLECGPDAVTSKELIFVEGRADIINLFRVGVKNTVALNGVKISDEIGKLSRERECGAFLDGDGGGDMVLDRLLQVAEIQWVARAPYGKEVEHLNRVQLLDHLNKKVSSDKIVLNRDNRQESRRRARKHGEQRAPWSQQGGKNSISAPNKTNPREKQMSRDRNRKQPSKKRSNSRKKKKRSKRTSDKRGRNKSRGSRKKSQSQRSHRRSNKRRSSKRRSKRRPRSRKPPKPTPAIMNHLKGLVGSNEGLLLDSNEQTLIQIPNTEVYSSLKEGIHTILIDGVVSQRLVDRILEHEIKRVIAVGIKKGLKIPKNADLKLYNFSDFL